MRLLWLIGMVKALDLLNAVMGGIEAVKGCQKIREIVVAALGRSPLGEAQVRRAKKSLNSLSIALTIDDKENINSKITDRTWSLSSPKSQIVFVSWALAAAIPCQDRVGLTVHLPVPKQMGWAGGLFGLFEKIREEWKRKEKKGTAGLLEEMRRMGSG